jgi:signal recognition particle subunit SRP54
MFSELSEKMELALKRIRGHGKISEKNVGDALKDVRFALLEADVNYKVVKRFTEDVKARALGEKVPASITPGQQFVKIVYDELTEIMGTHAKEIALASEPPTVILLVGLQGSGKTTAAAKLAKRLVAKDKKGMLIAADVYRPAAIEQLDTLARSVPVDVYYEEDEKNAVDIVMRGMERVRAHALDFAIVDTAGRLHIDEEMMGEVAAIKGALEPQETMLVADGMTGQDAVTIAGEFSSKLGIDGVILTKMDGDERGGAALSIKAVSGAPIRYIGVGEKTDALEVFHPARMASRILGMGDVLTLVERAQDAIDEKEAERLQRKILKETFSLDDFLEQIRQVKRMGPLEDIMGLIPGMSRMKGINLDERAMVRVEAIISSMTRDERLNPDIMDGSRRRRIASGSGTRVQDVNRLLKDFQEVRKLFRNIKKGKLSGLMRSFLTG